jgi:hypothetical protein
MLIGAALSFIIRNRRPSGVTAPACPAASRSSSRLGRDLGSTPRDNGQTRDQQCDKTHVQCQIEP